ncbi:site-specific integrase [Vibrio echinoideorum]|uniref:site-specific integrase n=1 Tax=Vibrio echinoideorum TaxID=2100116 RepID=UPI0010805F17|nr:site-specific integrase [Vibrio echinoideorum]
MYKVENCNDEFYCLFDLETATTPLLALRYLESELLEKALGTQKAYLESVKLFYDFWLAKFGVTLDYSFHKSEYTNVTAIADQVIAFWDYLLAGKLITNVVALPNGNIKAFNKVKATSAKRCRDICQFIHFLSDTYLNSGYVFDDLTTLRRYRADVKVQLDELKKKFSQWLRSNKESTSYDHLRSLTPEQFQDFIQVITPNKAKPKLAGFEILQVNALNPMISFEVQMRNYVLITLLVRYGLRIGESLLLRENSFLPYRLDESRFLMRIRTFQKEDLDDKTIDDARTYKPQIKTVDSVRDIDISIAHYKQIMFYYRYIRPKNCDHNFIFSSSMKPYKPIAYSTVMSEFKAYTNSFKESFPLHFDTHYAESIEGDITPHWLRHTWAYGTLCVIYEEVKREYITSGVVNFDPHQKFWTLS